MAITIIQSKDEAMAKRFFELNIKSDFELIENQADWLKILTTQESLFSNQKAINTFCFINMLRSNFKKELDALKKHEGGRKFLFLEYSLGKEKKYTPSFIRQEARVIDLDKLSKGFSFWQKVATKMGVKIEFSEWQEAINLIGNRLALLFSVLEQKQIVPKYKLDFFLSRFPEGNIFKFIDAVDKKDASAVFHWLHLFWVSEEKPGLIWNQLVRYFVNLGQLSEGLEPKIHPYALMQLKKSIVYYPRDELRELLRKLLDFDTKLKTGFLDSNDKEREVIYLLLFSWLFSPSSLPSQLV
jgi:DNA polymerase III delta subunit